MFMALGPMAIQVVWLKRDLRLYDHRPLLNALRSGPTLLIYIAEPTLWRQPDAAAQHWKFIAEALLDLDQSLRQAGWSHACLHLFVGEAVEVLQAIHRCLPIAALHAHMETGNGFTFARDRAVRRWAKEVGIPFHEVPQFAVIRGLRDRDLWLPYQQRFMREPVAPWPPPFTPVWAEWPLSPPEGVYPVAWWLLPDGSWRAGPWPTPRDWNLPDEDPPLRQKASRTLAKETLASFLTYRAQFYARHISSPLTAPTASSRLSPYLAYGLLSLREVWQATEAALEALGPFPSPQNRPLYAGLKAFQSRLYWHCHFIQKLETEPDIEFRCLHPAYEALRPPEAPPEWYAAFTEGRTGWPLVDACIAMLKATGWLNFRMRAMLVSTATYPLWMPWRPIGLWLARLFLDYEPGIHWPQIQMQAGTTGINTIRIYNPIRQAMRLDPKGEFVRKWLPYMRRVPDLWLFEPWRMPTDVQKRYGVIVGKDIPMPLVDLDKAIREAKERIFSLRKRPEVEEMAKIIIKRHGSRPGMPSGRDAEGREPTFRRRRRPSPPSLPSLF